MTHVETSEAGWKAEIRRRMTAKKQVVTKSKDGFKAETEAQAWVEVELKELLERLQQQSKQRSDDYAAGKNYDSL